MSHSSTVSSVYQSTMTEKSTTTPITTIGFSTTRSESEFKKDSIICVIEGRGNAQGEIGFAAFDKSASTFTVSQYIDDLTYSRTINKIEYFEPNEVVMLRKNTYVNNDLRFVLGKQFKNLKLTIIDRKVFNSNDELKNILKLCCEQFKSIEQDIQNKYYCIAATFFLLNFIESYYSIIFKNQTLKIIYSPVEEIMNIDPKTAKALEILINQVNNKETIFKILDRTHTVNGARMLKKTLIEPLTDEKSIKTRLDCVQELISSPELFEEVENILIRLDKINVTSVVISFLYNSKRFNPKEQGEKKIDNLMRLKNILEAIDPVKFMLKKCDNYLFKSYSKQLDDEGYVYMMDMIKTLIREDCRYTKGNYKTYLKFDLFRDRTLPELDLIKKLLKNEISKIRSLVADLSEKHTLPFNYRYNNSRKFYLFISIDDLRKNKDDLTLPVEFYNLKQSGKIMQFTCEELDRINLNFDRCLNTFFVTCNSLLNEPIDEIRKYIFCLYKFIDIISMLDLLQSFAKVSAKYRWNRPSFSDQLILTECIHPIYQFRDTKSITNNFHMSTYSNIAIITGPNNSGKTSVIKMIAICQLLAQLGCFVPCQTGTFKIIDRLFARIGSDNDFESNSSSFVNELKEVSYILTNCTDKSLIAIDELGRGTSAEEGWPFCWSIIEKFVIKNDFVLFTTHFKELTILAYHYDVVNNYYMETIEYSLCERDMLRFTYKVVPGFNRVEAYGIKLAEQTNMPKKIIDEAKKIKDTLPTINTYYNYLNSKSFKLRRLDYETGKLALRYKEINSRNPRFDYEQAMNNLIKAYREKLCDLEQMDDDSTIQNSQNSSDSTS